MSAGSGSGRVGSSRVGSVGSDLVGSRFRIKFFETCHSIDFQMLLFDILTHNTISCTFLKWRGNGNNNNNNNNNNKHSIYKAPICSLRG